MAQSMRKTHFEKNDLLKICIVKFHNFCRHQKDTRVNILTDTTLELLQLITYNKTMICFLKCLNMQTRHHLIKYLLLHTFLKHKSEINETPEYLFWMFSFH